MKYFLDEEKEGKVGHTLRSLVYISQSFLMGFFKYISVKPEFRLFLHWYIPFTIYI